MGKIHSDLELNRVVGIPTLAISVVNSTIGAGIFIVPGILAFQMGATAIFEYLCCSLIIGAVMLCYIEIGSNVTSSGGSYAYVRHAFGPLAGFIINWLLFFGWTMLACAALLNAIADSLAIIFPDLFLDVNRGMLFFILLMVMVILNVRSSINSVRLVKLVTLTKIILLLLIIILGFGHMNSVNLHLDHFPTEKALGENALFIFFAFAGFETTLSLSGEVKNPKRTIPAGILLGGVVVLVLYLLIQTVVQGTFGPKIGDYKNAPLAAIANLTFRPWGGIIIIIITAISCFGTICGDILNSPRVLFAGAKDGLFPKFLARVHPRFTTPYFAVITYASLIFVVSISSGFKQLAILASCAIMVIYLTVVLAMVKLKVSRNQYAEKRFKVPGGILVPMVAITGIMWMLSHLKTREIISTLIL